MNGLSWIPEAMAIWAMSRGRRPQGVEHDQGHPLEVLGMI